MSRETEPGPDVPQGETFTWPVRVYYEDTDAGGVVYYANYLKFMERARTEWLRALGFEQDDLRARHNLLFVVSRIRADFRLPVRFNELLDVTVRISRRGRASMELVQEVLRGGDTVVCTAEVRIACIDADRFRPRPIPSAVFEGVQT